MDLVEVSFGPCSFGIVVLIVLYRSIVIWVQDVQGSMFGTDGCDTSGGSIVTLTTLADAIPRSIHEQTPPVLVTMV
jgi:hypothetical protein